MKRLVSQRQLLLGCCSPVLTAGLVLADAGMSVLAQAVSSPVTRPPASAMRGVPTPGQNPRLDRLQGLRLQQINQFASLQAFRSSASNTTLQLGRAQLSLAPYLRSRSSLTSLSQRLQGRTIDGQLQGQARLFRAANGALVINEQLSFQRPASACGFAAIQPTQQTLCYVTKAARARPQEKKLKQAAASLKASLQAAVSGQSRAQLPAWARQLTVDQLRQLAQSSEAQLETTLLNTARTTISRTLMVPPPDVGRASLTKLTNLSSIERLNAQRNSLTKVTSSTPVQGRPGSFDLGSNLYLAGFTYGDSYEWADTYEYEVDYGLGKTLLRVIPYVEAYYGFGVRFPLMISGRYVYAGGASRTADVQVSMTPINANADQYRATSLDESLIFNGKEIVAEFGAKAGIQYLLPVVGLGELRYERKFDFAQYLPRNMNGGQFKPPHYRENFPLVDPIVMDLDLLGGQGNYSIDDYGFRLTAKPGLSIGLTSTDLGLNLIDFKNNSSVARLSYRASGGTSSAPLVGRVKVDQAGASAFSLADPYYNLALQLTPGVKLEGGLYLGSSELAVDEFIVFPSLAIQIPTNGVSFDCHKGTVCRRNFTISTQTGRQDRTADRRAGEEKQLLTLVRAGIIKDDEWGDDQYSRWNDERFQLSVSRGNTKSFKNQTQRNSPKRCAGGEVRLEDYDQVKVDAQGVARLYVKLEVFEGTSCNTSEREGSYDGIRANEPLLTVPPGRSMTASKKVSTGDGGYGQITYTLSNVTIR